MTFSCIGNRKKRASGAPRNWALASQATDQEVIIKQAVRRIGLGRAWHLA
jgi:hypothetical protein